MYIKKMAIKLIAAFFILLIYIKISGRKQLAPISPSDQVSNMVIGALVSGTIVSSEVSVRDSIIVVSIWAGLQILLRHLKYRSSRITDLIDGRRYRLMEEGLIRPEEFKEAKLSIMDFENTIHKQGVKSISEIRNAWFAPDGNISLDLKEERSQSNVLVFDHKFHQPSLEELGLDQEELEAILLREGYENLDRILCVEYYKSSLYIYTEDGNRQLKLK